MAGEEEPIETTVEETVENHVAPTSAKGLRLVLSLAMVAVGIALVGLGVFAISAEAVRVVTILGGLVLAGAFGHIANGATKIDVQGSSDGAGTTAEYPQDKTIRTRKTIVHTKGLPKHGAMPPKQGETPQESVGEIPRRREGDSG